MIDGDFARAGRLQDDGAEIEISDASQAANLYSTGTAIIVNGIRYSPAEVNYYFGNEYLTMVYTYGQYLSYFGLDTSTGLDGLDDQDTDADPDAGECVLHERIIREISH